MRGILTKKSVSKKLETDGIYDFALRLLFPELKWESNDIN